MVKYLIILALIFHVGSYGQYIAWNQWSKIQANIPPSGRVGFVNGQPAPQNERTYKVARCYQHSNGTNYYYWNTGGYPHPAFLQLTEEDIKVRGWLTGEE